MVRRPKRQRPGVDVKMLRDRASLIFLRVFSEEMVGCKLRSSEPCGCTLTLRDRFLWLSVLVRVGAERWGQRERGRGGDLGQGAEGRWARWGMRGARASAEEMHSKRERMARRCNVVLSDEWIR